MISREATEYARTSGKHVPQPCPRCGVPRILKAGRPNHTCRDCRDVLTPEEREAWAA